MWGYEQAALLMARERMEEAMRGAEEARAIRRARVPRPSMRITLGIALVRLGHRVMGQQVQMSRGPIMRGASQ
jgi:hypothetical protein